MYLRGGPGVTGHLGAPSACRATDGLQGTEPRPLFWKIDLPEAPGLRNQQNVEDVGALSVIVLFLSVFPFFKRNVSMSALSMKKIAAVICLLIRKSYMLLAHVSFIDAQIQNCVETGRERGIVVHPTSLKHI